MNLILKIFTLSPVFAADWSGDVATIADFNVVFENIAQSLVYFAGIAFLFMFIKGGFAYLTSSNDPKKTAQASSILTLSIMGIIGIILSFLIIKLIGQFTGIDNVGVFNIPNSPSSESVIKKTAPDDTSYPYQGIMKTGNTQPGVENQE